MDVYWERICNWVAKQRSDKNIAEGRIDTRGASPFAGPEYHRLGVFAECITSLHFGIAWPGVGVIGEPDLPYGIEVKGIFAHCKYLLPKPEDLANDRLNFVLVRASAHPRRFQILGWIPVIYARDLVIPRTLDDERGPCATVDSCHLWALSSLRQLIDLERCFESRVFHDWT